MKDYPILTAIEMAKEAIPYRRELRSLVKSVVSTILLTQIIYWWNKKKQRPFYKYKLPIEPQRPDETDADYEHRSAYYTKGDSWCEELNISREEFDSALKNIAHKKGEEELHPENPIIDCIEYYTTRERLTFYNIVKPDLLSRLIEAASIYDNLKDIYKSVNSTLANYRYPTLETEENPRLNISEITSETIKAETTTETGSKEPVEQFAPQTGFNREVFKSDRRSRAREVKLQLPPASGDAKYIIESLWKEKADSRLTQHKEGSKIYLSIAKVIDQMRAGTFFNETEFKDVYKGYRFNRRDFSLSFDRLIKAAFSPDYGPVNGGYKEYLQKLPLLTFLYNPDGKDRKHQSLFIHFLENEPERLSERLTAKIDKDAPAAQLLAEGFKRLANMNSHELNNVQWRDIGHTVDRIKKVLPEYREKIRRFDHHQSMGDYEDGESFLAKFIIEALEEEMLTSGLNITTGWLCSDTTFDRRLPDYLKRYNYMRKD